MSNELMTDSEILDAIEKKVLFHQKEAEKYRKMIDAYRGATLQEDTGKIHIQGSYAKKTAIRRNGSMTFEQSNLTILSDGTARTSRQLFDAFREMTGKEIGFSSFSSQLSTLMSKKDSIKKHVIPENPVDNRYYYGPKDWFEGDVMNENHLPK